MRYGHTLIFECTDRLRRHYQSSSYPRLLGLGLVINEDMRDALHSI